MNNLWFYLGRLLRVRVTLAGVFVGLVQKMSPVNATRLELSLRISVLSSSCDLSQQEDEVLGSQSGDLLGIKYVLY